MIQDSTITANYALYNGDCIEMMRDLPDAKIDLSIYSPPFCGLYQYSSDERDLSNCSTYQQFFIHYGYVVEQVARLTKPGRISYVHVMDVPGKGNGETARMGVGANVGTGLIDFPGDVIRLHEKYGFAYCGRRTIWKEPLAVRNRTMAKGLAHAQIVKDSTLTDVASADFLLEFRKAGENQVPVTHSQGLMNYAGENKMPADLLRYRGWTGNQIENRYSQWIWRQYASSVWMDVRTGRVLPFRDCREPDDEKHVHALQLDVIERAVILGSNPGEVVLTPFMGVGSEVFGAVLNGRKAIGAELKTSYYRQAVQNLQHINPDAETLELFDLPTEIEEDDEDTNELL
ncbi:MAG: DNA methyltransferase [Gallionella sp.]|jgi:DNA modification methylase